MPSYGNLAASLLAVEAFDDARAVLKEAADRQLDYTGARRLSYMLAFLEGDAATMTRELDSSLGVGQTNEAWGWQAHTSASTGQIAAAHDQFRRGIQRSLQGDFTEVASQLTMEDAEMHAVMGQCADARREAGAGLALSRDNTTLERASRAFAVCGDEAEALSLSSEVAKRCPDATRRDATLTNRVSVPVVAAALAIQQRRPERAIAALEPVRRYDAAPTAEFWPAYLRGEAYLLLKNADMAAAEFDSIVAHRGAVPGAVVYSLAWLGRARREYARLSAVNSAADHLATPESAGDHRTNRPRRSDGS